MLTKISFLLLLATSIGCGVSTISDSMELPTSSAASTCLEDGSCASDSCENLFDSKCEDGQSFVCGTASEASVNELVWVNTTGVDGYDVCEPTPESLPDGEGTPELDGNPEPDPGTEPAPEPEPEPSTEPAPDPNTEPEPEPTPPPASSSCDYSTATSRNVRVSNTSSTPLSGSCNEGPPEEDANGVCYLDELYAECPGSNNTQFQSCFAGNWTSCP